MIEEYTSREQNIVSILMHEVRCGRIISSTTNRDAYEIVRQKYNELENNYNNRVSSNL